MKSELPPEDLRVKAGIRSPKVPLKISWGLWIALYVGGPLLVLLYLGGSFFALWHGAHWPNPETGQVYKVCLGRFGCNPEYLTHRDFTIFQIVQASLWVLIVAAVAFFVLSLARSARKQGLPK